MDKIKFEKIAKEAKKAVAKVYEKNQELPEFLIGIRNVIDEDTEETTSIVHRMSANDIFYVIGNLIQNIEKNTGASKAEIFVRIISAIEKQES